MLLFESNVLNGILIVLVLLGILAFIGYMLRIPESLFENAPRYTADILGDRAIAHDSINPRGFVFYQNRVYPARALDKYISQGQTVIIVAFEKDVLVVRPKSAIDDKDTVE